MRSGCPGFNDSARAFTLFEVVVAASLTLILFGMLFSVLAPALHSSGREAVQVELQQIGFLASEKLIKDLERSAPTALVFQIPANPTEPAAVGIQAIRDVSAEGTQLWEDHLVVYSWDRGQGQLIRKVWPPFPPDLLKPLPTNQPTSLTPAELWQIATTPNGTERVLAGNVVDFGVTPNGTAIQPVRLHLILEAEAPGSERKERFELRRDVLLRQSTF